MKPYSICHGFWETAERECLGIVNDCDVFLDKTWSYGQHRIAFFLSRKGMSKVKFPLWWSHWDWGGIIGTLPGWCWWYSRQNFEFTKTLDCKTSTWEKRVRYFGCTFSWQLVERGHRLFAWICHFILDMSDFWFVAKITWNCQWQEPRHSALLAFQPAIVGKHSTKSSIHSVVHSVEEDHREPNYAKFDSQDRQSQYSIFSIQINFFHKSDFDFDHSRLLTKLAQ
jgi:hypothetical protein